MKLFNLDKSYNVVIEPETALLLPFKTLIARDKSKDKIQAKNELAFIYFYCDVRSDYSSFTDLEERFKAIKLDIMLPEKWVIDDKVSAAIDFYNTRSKTITKKILEDSIYVADKVSTKLKESVDEDLDLADLDKVLNGLRKIPEVIKAIAIAEKAVIREIEEAKGNIGAKEKALFEDGELDDDNEDN